MATSIAPYTALHCRLRRYQLRRRHHSYRHRRIFFRRFLHLRRLHHNHSHRFIPYTSTTTTTATEGDEAATPTTATATAPTGVVYTGLFSRNISRRLWRRILDRDWMSASRRRRLRSARFWFSVFLSFSFLQGRFMRMTRGWRE